MTKLSKLIESFSKDQNGIFHKKEKNFSFIQDVELKLREEVTAKQYDDYLLEISKNHSIPVMDYEINRFLKKIPFNGNVIDVGGCWGWHWRNIKQLRPDVTIYIVDFVKENLLHAIRVLDKSLLNTQIFLVHADATNLPFTDESFDGYWTVHTLQHIPNFEDAIKESKRVLKNNGVFTNYSLNNALATKLIYKLFKKNYHVKGYVDNVFYLELFSIEQLNIINKYYQNTSNLRFSEILFQPSLKLTTAGRYNFLDLHDRMIKNLSLIGNIFARQVFIIATKNHLTPKR